jgi:ABC-2 type transport system permease protein
MNLRRTLAITARLFSQFRHDHRTLGILFVTPLIILALFWALLGGTAPEPTLGVVNLDAGTLGAAVTKALDASDVVAATDLADADAGEAGISDGSLDGYLVLPATFSADAQAGSLRPLITVEGTDASHTTRIVAATQAAVIDAVRSFAPPVPSAAPAPSVPELDPQVAYRYGDGNLDPLDLIGGPFIGLIVFFLVYVVTSVSFLRERSLGTLERLMATPLRRPEIVVGYLLGFGVVAVIQAAEVLAFGLLVLGLYNVGSVALIFGLLLLLSVGAVSLGIFLSTFARSEFEAVQFIPLVMVPQILLSGIIVPVESEPSWLQPVSNVLPLTYAVNALRDVMLRGAGLAELWLEVAVLGGFVVLVLAAASATLRREVA